MVQSANRIRCAHEQSSIPLSEGRDDLQELVCHSVRWALAHSLACRGDLLHLVNEDEDLLEFIHLRESFMEGLSQSSRIRSKS